MKLPGAITLRAGSPAKSVLVFVSIVSLCGCAVHLAPDYDKTIVDGLTSANVGLMELFASASGGTSKEAFSEREERYNKLIGLLDALRLQSSARQVHQPLLSQLFPSKAGTAAEPQENESPKPPSTNSIGLMVKTITKMRDTDKKQGLTNVEVAAFKGQIEISMDQALTYEKALER